jgi:hypothetical protein|tara:strand:+ start:357 stop:527 length:171 start_codon:yes stop_codon:yes gene_type:complete
MNCWNCNTELIWGGDHDLEADYMPAIMGEDYTILTNLSCPSEDCGAYVEVYHGKNW